MFKMFFRLIGLNVISLSFAEDDYGSSLLDNFGEGMDQDIGEDDSSNGKNPKVKKDKDPSENIFTKEQGEKLQQQIQDYQEKNNELQEELKDLKSFKDRIVGKTDEQKQEMLEKELLKQYNEDPTGYIDKRVEEKLQALKSLESRIQKAETQYLGNQLMDSISKEYDIDWESDGHEVAEKLKLFSPDARQSNPRDCILQAMKLTGKLKRKEKSSGNDNLPFMEGNDFGQAMGRLEKNESDKLSEGILNAKGKKILDI